MNQAKPFFGKTLKRSLLKEMTLSETSYSPFTKLSKHAHDFAYFCFVLDGSYLEKKGAGEYLCDPSTFIFHLPNDPHSNSFNRKGGRCLNVRFADSLLIRVGELIRLPKISNARKDVFTTNSMNRLYREFQDFDEFSQIAIEGIVLEILAAISRDDLFEGKYRPKWLESAKEILHERFCESLSLNEISETVGRHPVHLAREFRRHFRCTIGDYIRCLRVEFASRELSKTNHTLSEIALSAGFSHQSHFTKTFRRITGKTPSEFRQISRSR